MVAVNAVGDSAESTQLAVIASDYPDQPLQPLKGSASPTHITIDWQTPYDGGIALTAYSIYWNGLDTSSNDYTLLATTDANTLTYTETNIVAGDNYKFKVSATNDVGEGP